MLPTLPSFAKLSWTLEIPGKHAAQIELWRTEQWETPYYWAAFTLQGEWR